LTRINKSPRQAREHVVSARSVSARCEESPIGTKRRPCRWPGGWA